ncbi:sensor domain-containing diguanylate cyclase [Zoogloea sp.]|uniref:sensor domain-containing diguanylate cyclase n=1 Tax=Zoogloea sp. TaxID=49181 RepID=UPI00262B551A|nr:sensor domain-containing diguanylate cyclase [Zoogloea sp.]MDD3352516.1 diguanylate cyclase [Zoogloea sp.]
MSSTPVRSLDEQQARCFQRAAEQGHAIECWINGAGGLLRITPSVERLTGVSPATLLASEDFIQSLIHDKDRRFLRAQIRSCLAGGAGGDFELRLCKPPADALWVACHLQPVHAEDGARLGLLAIFQDIQARKVAEFELLETVAALRRAQALSEHYLRRSEEERSRLSSLLGVLRLGILFMDQERRVVYCNPAFYRLWGISEADAGVGVRDVVLKQWVLPQLADPAAYLQHLEDVLAHMEPSTPYEILLADGRLVTDMSRVVPGPHGAHPIGRMWVFEDVTEQRRVAAQLTYLAERDPLTNLYNRRRFHEELERMLADARRHGDRVGLLGIDLDGFKPVNDRFGHQAGDEVLVGLARTVGAVIRRNEMFFRLGGDEFAILVPAATAAGLAELARRVCQSIAGQHFHFDGQDTGVTASIGITLGSGDLCSGEQLIAAADRAMYQAKSQGGNGWKQGLPGTDGVNLDQSAPEG